MTFPATRAPSRQSWALDARTETPTSAPDTAVSIVGGRFLSPLLGSRSGAGSARVTRAMRSAAVGSSGNAPRIFESVASKPAGVTAFGLGGIGVGTISLAPSGQVVRLELPITP